LKLSKTQIRTIENGLEDKKTLVVWRHSNKVRINVRQRHIYPSEAATKTVRISKEHYDKIVARARRDGTSLSVALDNMLIEALRKQVVRALQALLLTKDTGNHIS
jgi:hypothetical protein